VVGVFAAFAKRLDLAEGVSRDNGLSAHLHHLGGDVTRDTMTELRVVLDTSVICIIAALRSSEGAAAETLRLALHQEIAILIDYKLACEYRDVALRVQHLIASGKGKQETELILDMLESVAEPVVVRDRYGPLSPDVADDMVLEVAINGSADGIVTYNPRHFREPARLFRLPVLSPAELLNEFRSRR
jgi:predicted nucleic acid-binding protein